MLQIRAWNSGLRADLAAEKREVVSLFAESRRKLSVYLLASDCDVAVMRICASRGVAIACLISAMRSPPYLKPSLA